MAGSVAGGRRRVSTVQDRALEPFSGRVYSANFLRHDKSLRDHACDRAPDSAVRGISPDVNGDAFRDGRRRGEVSAHCGLADVNVGRIPSPPTTELDSVGSRRSSLGSARRLNILLQSVGFAGSPAVAAFCQLTHAHRAWHILGLGRERAVIRCSRPRPLMVAGARFPSAGCDDVRITWGVAVRWQAHPMVRKRRRRAGGIRPPRRAHPVGARRASLRR